MGRSPTGAVDQSQVRQPPRQSRGANRGVMAERTGPMHRHTLATGGCRSGGPIAMSRLQKREERMAGEPEITNMALFCDFENIALGVRDAKYAQFDIRKVLERLLLKGSIVVKKAYCDWERYKEFKATMHEAAFELIEIPHVRQSGKNSADIRMVVDALDLCYTKSHVDTFVIISGDSDFSPLVSKLRENNKYVIGIGVKESTSDLLAANCDEFIFYDDLVREQEAKNKRAASKTTARTSAPAAKKAAPRPRRNGARKRSISWLKPSRR